MPVNLISVPSEDGPLWVGVTQISAVVPTKAGKTCVLHLVSGEQFHLLCPPKVVADLANRRPPDGF